VKKLTPATDATNPAFFGQSVALDGDLVIVGAPGDALAETTAAGTVAGSAYLYSRNLGGSENWGLLRRFVASDPHTYDYFGAAVALQGTTVAIGAPGVDTTDVAEAGAVYIYRQNSGGTNSYAEVKKLTASDPTTYADFGRSIAVLDADRILVGAPLVNTAYLYTKDSNGLTDNYAELKKITSTDTRPSDNFGAAVALTSTNLLIGAPGKGAAYIFAKDQGGVDNYGEVKKLTGSDASSFSGFGRTVALANTFALIGAYGATPSDLSGAGAAYVFEQNTGGADAWNEVSQYAASDAATGAYFGWSVSANNALAAIGAMHTTTGGLTESGASYIFNLTTNCIFGSGTFGGCSFG
jgi:hypothetical protein